MQYSANHSVSGGVFVMLLLSLILLKTVSASTLQIDSTETSIDQFKEFSDATGFISTAEKQGGRVYEVGWVVKMGWNWRNPYGVKGELNEPAVHITFDEAKAYCEWRGKRLPTRLEWIHLAYTEQRLSPPKPFIRGKTYRYPTGSSSKGANCLNECDAESLLKYKKEDNSSVLLRGFGHSHVGVTKQGVNGLSDMGANVWEWAKIEDGGNKQAIMGGSWWYGARQMQADYNALKTRDMAAVYIGFRCIKD